MITYKQGLLHRWSWYTVVLEKKDIDKCYCYHREDESIKPFNHGAVFAVALFPEGPVDFLTDINVIDYGQTEQQPEITHPYDPQQE